MKYRLKNVPTIDAFKYDKRYCIDELEKVAPKWLLDEINDNIGCICFINGRLFYSDWDMEEICVGSYIILEKGGTPYTCDVEEFEKMYEIAE